MKNGHERQNLAFDEIKKYKISEILEEYNPILIGTIPIGIDLPKSGLDIICECENQSEFRIYLSREFPERKDYKIYTVNHYGIIKTGNKNCNQHRQP